MIFSELLYAAKNGDAFATEALLKMYHPLLYVKNAPPAPLARQNRATPTER